MARIVYAPAHGVITYDGDRLAGLIEDTAATIGAQTGTDDFAVATSPQDNSYTSIVYGNGTWVAISSDGTNRVIYSLDNGTTWTLGTAAEANSWQAVTFGAGVFVAVASSGTNRVMTSADGIAWVARTAAQANTWRSVTFGEGLFVAVASDGTNRVMTSPTGVTWTVRTAANAVQWVSVTHGAGTFVAVANTGTAAQMVQSSADGVTWVARTATSTNSWASIAYGDGLFVATSTDGAVATQIMSSADGVTWVARTSPAANQWKSVCWGNGVFVAVSITGTGDRIMTSNDGITWYGDTSPADNTWNSVAFGNNLYVAVASSGTANRIMVSVPLETIVDYSPTNMALEIVGSLTVSNADTNTGLKAYSGFSTSNYIKQSYRDELDVGTGDFYISAMVKLSSAPIASIPGVWTSRNYVVNQPSYCICFGGGQFVTRSYNDTISMTSPDGITWTTRTGGAQAYWRGLAYSPELSLFISVATSGTNRLQSSPTAVTWTTRTPPESNAWEAVAWSGAEFAAVASSGTNRVMRSTDGVTWSAVAASAANQWRSITFGNGIFVAVSDTGTGNRVMTSPTGVTWTSQTSASDVAWVGVTYGAGLFVAVAHSVGTTQSVMTSPDGIAWTIRTAALVANWRSVTYGAGAFCAVGSDNGVNVTMFSTDGVIWTSRSAVSSTNDWYSVAYGAGLFCAVSITGTPSDRIMTNPGIESGSNIVLSRFSEDLLIGFNVGVTDNGLVYFKIQESSTDYIVYSTTDIIDGLWHHIHANRRELLQEIYIDNVREAVGIAPTGSISNNNATVLIGIGQDLVSAQAFGGSIAVAKIGDALTDDQREASYYQERALFRPGALFSPPAETLTIDLPILNSSGWSDTDSKNTVESISLARETLFHDSYRVYDVQLKPIPHYSATVFDMRALRNFVDAVKRGQTFTFEERYGLSNNDGPVNVVLESTNQSYNRHGDMQDVYSGSLKLREVD